MSTSYEYHIVEIKPGLMGGFKTEVVQEALVREGRKGWELVQVITTSAVTPMLAVFKRAG